jgi:hypothetical protein
MVYWRRRLVIGLAAMVTLIVLFNSFTGGDDPVATVTSASPSATELIVSPEPTSSPSSVESLTPETAQPTAQPSAPTAADGECSDADTSIRVAIDRGTTAVGEGVHITMILKNISTTTCQRDVGSGANEVTVTSGPALIWSTDHCNSSTDKDLVELAPGEEWKVKVVWIGKLTAQGCNVKDFAQPGAYWVNGRNASLESDGVRFVVE